MFDCGNYHYANINEWECRAIDANFIIDCTLGSLLILLFGYTIYRAS